VWRAPLDVDAKTLASLRGDLSAEELERAGRMRFASLRDAAVASAGILRAVLAPYTGKRPAELEFARGPHGKPALRSPPDHAAPRFNLSHSGTLLLIAIADREVGIDAEEVVPSRIDDLLAERVLTARELHLWRSAPGDQRARLFFQVWTHKEACVKATGKGLSCDPLSLEVLFSHDDGRPHLACEIREQADRFSLCELEAGSDHAACLAVAGAPWTIRTWNAGVDRAV
jgi:4'-phosphopantetheinyl transferase